MESTYHFVRPRPPTLIRTEYHLQPWVAFIILLTLVSIIDLNRGSGVNLVVCCLLRLPGLLFSIGKISRTVTC